MSLHDPETGRWNDVSFVISSHYRIAALERLVESPATPSQIATDSDNPMSHISRALQELRERSLVTLLVSESMKKGRVYGITEEAEQVWDTIEMENML